MAFRTMLFVLSNPNAEDRCPGFRTRPRKTLPMSYIRLTRWLQAPFVTGGSALVCGVVAVALPTIIRVSANGVVTGCEFTPYLPFVLLSAILLRWWQAGAVALASAAVFSGVFVGPPSAFLEESCAIS